MIKNGTEIKKLGLAGSFAVYVPAALLMAGMSGYMIPFLSEKTGMETILAWFIVAGAGIFAPLIAAGLIILKKEGYRISAETWTHRLRFRRITTKDLLLTLSGLALTGILSGLMVKGVALISGEFNHSPQFMSFRPLHAGRYWLLLAWLPYWILNIMGEEFLWRGVMLPRQEKAFGRYAWVIHGSGWALFHVAFGWQLLLTLLPLIFIQSYVVVRTKNSWIGVLMHGGINGPAFLAICFGLL